MKLFEYYVQLYADLGKAKTHEPVKATRAEVSNVLECSERNAIHILNKMEEKQWISRMKGKGRGNFTTLHFRKSLEEMLQYFEESAPKHQDIERLLSLFEQKQLFNGQLLDSLILRLFGVRERKNEGEEYDVLKIPYFRSLYSLDPAVVERQTERHIVEHIFNTLVIYNSEKKQVEPCLSYYWEQEMEGRRWTFYLRKGVRFHHGKMLEADDVKFSFQRLKETPSKWIVKNIKEIQSISKHIIQFEFSIPMYGWDRILCASKCSIVPMDLGQRSHEEFAKQPIGTGPYQVKIHEQNYLLLTVHHGYFQERVHIDEVAIYLLSTIEKYFSETSIGSVSYIPFSFENRVEKNFHSTQRNHLAVKFLIWNMKKEAIAQQVQLRKTIASIVNRSKLVQELGYPRLETRSSFTNSYQGEVPVETVELKLEDPLLLLTYDLTPNKEDVEWIKRECSKHGISIDTQILPYEQFLTESHAADILLAEYLIEEDDELGLYNVFLSETGVIAYLVEDSFVDLTIEEAFQQSDSKDRKDLLEVVDEYLVNEYVVLPLYSTYQKALYHKDLRGVSLNASGLVSFKDLFFRKKR